MKLYYDLHIHSALSPCGDMDMTPNNIVNMSLLKGLDVIAVTDHNSCGNIRAVIEAAAGRLLVIPGMEVETSEEVHVLCYFSTVEQAEKMGRIVREHMRPIRNHPDIFGRQCYLNANDDIIGEEELLLISATTLSIYEVAETAAACGGVAVPAHIDRTSNSVLANLGFFPPDLNVQAVEITKQGLAALREDYRSFHVITDSDAHYLGDIAEPEFTVDVSNKNAKEILCSFTDSNLK